MAYKKGSSVYKKLTKINSSEWVLNSGLMQTAFKTSPTPVEENTFKLEGTLPEISENKKQFNSKTPFLDAGIMIDRKVVTYKTKPEYLGPSILLADVLIEDDDVDYDYWISDNELEKWKYLKGGKKETRITNEGFEYFYSEGPVAFPDALEKPSRTIVTGEGGRSPSRFKHVVQSNSGRYRRLMPLELERLNMFPDNHTIEASDTKRAFFMGNALVVGVVTKLGMELKKFSSSK